MKRKIIDKKLLFICIFFITSSVNCSDQKIEPFDIPIDGVLVYVEGVRGEGWLTANPFGELVVLDSESQKRHVLTNDGYYYAYPNLTPDGKSLIFESKRDRNIGTIGLSADSEIYQMNLETGEIINLNEKISSLIGKSLGHRISHPSLSPSGNKLAMVRMVDWKFHLSYFDFDKSEIVDITIDDSYSPVGGIAWSPDNKKMIYSVGRGFRTSIIMIDIGNNTEPDIIPIESYNEDGEPYGCGAGSWFNNYTFKYSCSRHNSGYVKIFEYDLRTSSKKSKTLYRNEFEIRVSNLIRSKNEEIVLFIGTIPGTQFNNIYSLNLVNDEVKQITFSENEKRWLRWYE